jgi:pantoate--beta-alanine ligase
MKVIRLPAKLSAITGKLKLKNKKIGLVPTMGALHEGHLSLMRKARKECDYLIVSIFVNPAQFCAGEDFKKYPRKLSGDLALCRKAKVDIAFLPQSKDIYPEGFSTFVDVAGLSSVLCGAARPGHFRGVATVVLKLFNITRADSAYFGQKDAQQAAVISRMVKDLNLSVKLNIMPIVRDEDGLALSSRNAYLGKEERLEALALSRALGLGRFLFDHGLIDAKRILLRLRQLITKQKRAVIDYIAIVDAETLKPVKKVSRGCLIALAVKFGKTRLIDNIII